MPYVKLKAEPAGGIPMPAGSTYVSRPEIMTSDTTANTAPDDSAEAPPGHVKRLGWGGCRGPRDMSLRSDTHCTAGSAREVVCARV